MLFTKMHGLGNDYLYVYGEAPENTPDLSVLLSERHFGAGSDGMIFISDSETADFKMRIFNADGSEAKMCGNGIRCVGKYVYEKGYTDKTELAVETLSGIKYLRLNLKDGEVVSVRVDMGRAEAQKETRLAFSVEPERTVLSNFLKEELICIPVSVGNPHAVFFVREMDRVPLENLGPKIEHHPFFPDGVNAEFVQVLGENELRMRVWERGSGITMACGTGACASVFAAVTQKICSFDRPVSVHLDGGTLEIEVKKDGTVFMTGPCEFVYDAVYPAETKKR